MKVHKFLVILLLLAGLAFHVHAESTIGEVVSIKRHKNAVIFDCEDGQKVKLSIITDQVIRIEVAKNGEFQPSKTIRNNFV